MKVTPVNRLDESKLKKLTEILPFYRSVLQQDKEQFERLIKHSRLVEFSSSERVLASGDKGEELCFLVRGRLKVMSNEGVLANYVTQGESFGDLAMLMGKQRSANVIVDEAIKSCDVVFTDFIAFGALADFSILTLATKLAYYRNLNHSLRWKLDWYRTHYPASALSNQHRQIKLYTGTPDSMSELTSLHDQAIQLGNLLVEWTMSVDELEPAVIENYPYFQS